MYFERDFKNVFLQRVDYTRMKYVSGKYEFDKIYNFMEQSICEIIENRTALPWNCIDAMFAI